MSSLSVSKSHCSHPSSRSDCCGSASGDAGVINVVPHTVLGAAGLVDGEARVAKEDPWRFGHGGEVPASSEDGANACSSSLEKPSDITMGLFRRAIAHRSSSSAFSARCLSLSSLLSLSLLRFRRFSISSLNWSSISGPTTSVQLHSRNPTSQPYGR